MVFNKKGLKSNIICWNLEAHEIALCMVTSQKMENTATNDVNLSSSLGKRKRGIADHLQISETLATFLHSNILSFAGNHQMQIFETKGKKLIQIHGMLDIYVMEKMYTAIASTTLDGVGNSGLLTR
jgi:hypothetical protein